MMRKGEWVRVYIYYPRSPRLEGEHQGVVEKVGRFGSGFVYFKLREDPNAYPMSSKYCEILERRAS